MAEPLLTYIVPVYGTESWLDRCADSIMRQSLEDWRMVLVDDGSPDGAGAVCDRYAASDSRIEVVHTPNRGISAARNLGLGMVRTPYVSFVDSDDFLHPQFGEALVRLMRDTGCPAAACADLKFTGELPGAALAPVSPAAMPRRVYPSGQAYGLMLHQTTGLNVSVCGKVYDMRLWEGCRFTEGRRYEDLEVSARIFPGCGSIVYTPVPMYFYRQHEGSYMHVFGPGRLDALWAAESIRDEVYSRYPSLRRAADDRLLSACLNITGLIAASGTRMPEVEQRCWERVRSLRRGTLTDRGARLKNRLGALLTYAGPRVFRLLAKLSFANK